MRKRKRGRTSWYRNEHARQRRRKIRAEEQRRLAERISKQTCPRVILPAIPGVLQPMVPVIWNVITPVVVGTTTLVNPTELTRLESSESILPDLKNPNLFSQERLLNSTSVSTTMGTVNSEATFLSSVKVEPEDSIVELFDDSTMDPSRPPGSPWEFHPALQSLSWLIGCWKSITAASCATMETVPYREEMQFLGTMQPVLQYKSETWHTETQKLMDFESGLLRVDPGLKMAALMVAHNFGVVELSEGVLCDQPILVLKSKSISRVSFTKNASVIEIVRSFELKGNILTSTVSMATIMEPLRKHLIMKYEKVL